MYKVAQFFSFLSAAIHKQISFFIVALIFFLAILLSVSVFFRYILNDSIYWSSEVARYCLVYLVFFGATMAHKNKTHIRIDIILSHMSATNQNRIELLVSGLLIFFWGLVMAGCVKLLPLFMMQKTATLEIPFAVAFAAVPLSALIWILYCFDDILNVLVKKT
ncbi:MAG: TRAP transporter small permease [Sulfurospirillum sp.]|nr:TRAP transporter small permease [Sulfurospirillum sp.]